MLKEMLTISGNCVSFFVSKTARLLALPTPLLLGKHLFGRGALAIQPLANVTHNPRQEVGAERVDAVARSERCFEQTPCVFGFAAHALNSAAIGGNGCHAPVVASKTEALVA